MYKGRSQRERWSNLRAPCRAARGPQHATRAHVQVASSRRDANPPRERSAEPTSPGREAAREGNETRDAAPVRHLSPWIKESAPSSATSSPLAPERLANNDKKCPRSSGSNTEGEARTDTTTRGTSSNPRTPPRSSRKGTLRHERRAGGIRESKARIRTRGARSLTPNRPTRASAAAVARLSSSVAAPTHVPRIERGPFWVPAILPSRPPVRLRGETPSNARSDPSPTRRSTSSASARPLPARPRAGKGPGGPVGR